MTKNHYDSQNALFQSSEYLASTLTRCAFIEKNFFITTATLKQDVNWEMQLFKQKCKKTFHDDYKAIGDQGASNDT